MPEADGVSERRTAMNAPQPEPPVASTAAPSEATTQEAPDDKQMMSSSISHLVQVRFGKQERSILLSANGETWTPFAAWNRDERKNKPTLCRAINKLIGLKLVESGYDYPHGGARSPEANETNTQPTRRRIRGGEQTYRLGFTRITRRIIGEEQTYRTTVYVRKLKLTTLGAAVVDQFRDVLASGKRIRWARFKPPSLPPEPPPPRPRELQRPEQEELRLLLVAIRNVTVVLPAAIESMRDQAARLPDAERELRRGKRQLKTWRQRVAELGSAGVTVGVNRIGPDGNWVAYAD
jgi:hypothetical protein